MKSLALRMTAESPLAIRSDHAPGRADNIKYIPGTAVRGCLATLYHMFYRKNEKMEDFAPLFLHERVSYPNLYPALFDDEGLQDRDSLPVYPLPKTAQSCKRHSGFVFPDTDTNDGHGARDTLIDWGLFKLAQKSTAALKIFRQSRDCHCGEAMDSFEGFYRRSDINPYPHIKSTHDGYTRLQAHTGIDRDSGIVQEGILYNRQVFDEGMQFWGRVDFHDEDEKLLIRFEDFLNEIGSTGLVRIGTGRTRGMGKVAISAERMEGSDDRSQHFLKRLNEFSSTFQARAHELEQEKLPYEFFFALTLHAPMILCDDLLRYRGIIDTHVLEELLGCSVPGLRSLYHAANLRRVSGWQELWGLPRTSEYAIESGSVFLFACPSFPEDNVLKALFTLEEHGAGKRRAEGFGRICVSDSFHQLIHQESL